MTKIAADNVLTIVMALTLNTSYFDSLAWGDEILSEQCERVAIDIAGGVTHVQTHWNVKKNHACGGQIEVALRKNNGVVPDGFLDNVAVVKKALHGTAGTINTVSGSGFAYAPRRDFVGSDAFEITVDHHLYSSTVTQKVNISIDVNVVN